MKDDIKGKILSFFSNRLLILTTLIFSMFYFIASRLFDLQIVNSEQYTKGENITKLETVPINAPRGTIYDRFGRPLAINKSAFVIKMNPGIKIENINEALLNFANFMEDNGESYETEFPISRQKPYTFEFDTPQKEKRYKSDINIAQDLDANEAMIALRKKFKIDEKISDDDAYKIISLRSLIYVNRYALHVPITIAYDIKEDTVIKLEEHKDLFKMFYYDMVALREYPEGKYVSHMIGYTGKINEKEYKENKQKGYVIDDKIGKTGLERSFEDNFRGVAGEQVVEMDQNLRPSKVISTKLPVSGDKLFTTIDSNYQKKIFDFTEQMLKQTVINKLKGTEPKEPQVSLTKLFVKMVESNTIAIWDIEKNADLKYAKKVIDEIDKGVLVIEAQRKEKIEKGELKQETDKDKIKVINERDKKAALKKAIEENQISSRTMILLMHDLKLITGDQKFVRNVENGQLGALQVILKKIEEDEITPQMANLDPSSASIIVIDVSNGDVLAAVNYPTFDNNKFVNKFDSAYFKKINNDTTSPLNNRVFMEVRAPGSTFKMLSAIAGLDMGIITPNQKILDMVEFTKAGKPYAKNWSNTSLGYINVKQALEHSVNYFFSEVSYQMGNSKNGKTIEAINSLNKYMIEFGLNDRSGVEIGEYRDTLKDLPLTVSSPSFKEYIVKSRFENPPKRDVDWVDGDTIRTSFGQAFNSYTVAVMGKYTAMLATKGVKRDLHLMDTLYERNTVKKYVQNEEERIDVREENFDVVKEGMLLVTKSGTASSIFSDFPIAVAGKTGTAQEDSRRPDHVSFAGFAPADNPQIAVYSLVPYGDTKVTNKPAAQIARFAISEYFGLNHEPEIKNQTKVFSK